MTRARASGSGAARPPRVRVAERADALRDLLRKLDPAET